MADARRSDEWWRASELMALLANCNRDPKKPPMKPDLFNTYRRSKALASRPRRVTLTAEERARMRDDFTAAFGEKGPANNG